MNPHVLLLVLSGTLLVAVGDILAAKGWVQRLFLSGFVTGLLIWSGIGAAYPEVSTRYLVSYFVFLLAFVVSFHGFLKAFSRISRLVGGKLPAFLSSVDRDKVWVMVVFVFLGLHLFPLVYPQFRLQELFVPSLPDLRSFSARRWAEQEVDVVAQVVEYVRVLLTPFFYIALYRYRRRLVHLTVVLTVLTYVRYVAAGYLGRGDIALVGLLVWLAAWRLYPSQRRLLVILGVISGLLVLWGFYIYGIVRIGGTPEGQDFFESIGALLVMETSFPRDVGMRIAESGARVDLAAYFTWIATLPFPKLLTGPFEVARINYDISELVLGVGPGDRGWYIVLPGLVSESIYVYGPAFYWLHAVLLAGVGAFVVRLVERTPQLLFLTLYIILQFAYALNRAGISAFLPVVVNQLLLFYFFLAVVLLGPSRSSLFRGHIVRQRGLVGPTKPV